MENELKKEDYENISRLINISQQINSLYDELYQLELTNQKEEYISTINKLKSMLLIEDDIYVKIGNSYEKNIQILNYLKENRPLSLLSQDDLVFETELVIMRIVSKLNKNVLADSQNLIPDEIKTNPLLAQQITQILTSSINIRDSILTDLMYCLLAIIQKESDINVHQYLKKVKYKISYLYPKIEKNMLERNFSVEENPWMETILIGQINHYPKDVINEIKQLYGKEYYNKILETMLIYDDEDLKDDQTMNAVLLKQFFLRAIFLLLDDETIMDLNDEFHDLLDNCELQKIFKRKQKIIKMILSAYRKVKQDKSIPKIISLKL